MQGETLGGRYAILRMLGEGGMGAVYEARHTGTGRRVAVKVINAATSGRKDLVARFEVEAKAAGQIESRHIAQVLDVGVDEGRPYLVMEYLEGEDLQQLIRRLGPLPRALALRVLAQACAGLEKAHAAGIIHRDIKPANIFLARQDGDVVVKLLDFGVAKIRPEASSGMDSADLTRTGSLLGSPLYMSPEQARGLKSIDQRTDLWSLGVVLYQALAGVTPFHEIETMGELILTICGRRAPNIQDRAPWVEPDLARIVARTLEIETAKRYTSATELLGELRALASTGTTIDGGMIAPLAPGEAQIIAPRAPTLDATPAQTGASASTTGAPSVAATAISPTSVAQVGSTTAATASERKISAPPAAGSKAPLLAAIATLVLVGGGAVFYASRGPSVPPPTNAQPSPGPSVVEASPAPSVAPTQTAATDAPKIAPSEPLPSATAAASATPSADPKAAALTSPASKATAKAAVTAKPTATAIAPPGTPPASVSGRIIRTDLP